MARAEAQKRELEAERLAAEADSRSERADAVRRERDEQLRLADLRDPDVETDEDGNRLDGRAGLDGQDTAARHRDGPGRHVRRAAHGLDTWPTVRDDGVRDGASTPSGATTRPPTGPSRPLDERADSYEPRRTGTV